MNLPETLIRGLFPVPGFDENTDHDYYQKLFTDPSLVEERCKFLECADAIHRQLVKTVKPMRARGVMEGMGVGQHIE